MDAAWEQRGLCEGCQSASCSSMGCPYIQGGWQEYSQLQQAICKQLAQGCPK